MEKLEAGTHTFQESAEMRYRQVAGVAMGEQP
jgi:hypothetical protein